MKFTETIPTTACALMRSSERVAVKVSEFRDVPPDHWDSVWRASDDAWLFHSASWVDFESRHNWDRNVSFALMDHGSTAAVLPLYEGHLGNVKVLLSGLHRHAGLAIHPDYLQSARHIQGMCMTHLRSLASDCGASRIHLSVQNLAPRNLTVERDHVPFWIQDYGYHLGLVVTRLGIDAIRGRSNLFADQVIDLRPETAKIFGRFSSACRRAIRRSEEKNLHFYVPAGAQAAEGYAEIAAVSALRTAESIRSAGYYDDLVRLAEMGRAVIFHIKSDSLIVAAAVVLLDKGSASYLSGASDAQFHGLHVNDFLHWNIIKWLRRNGYAHYRLGPTFPEVPSDWPVAKVAAFKARFGGRSLPVIQGFEEVKSVEVA